MKLMDKRDRAKVTKLTPAQVRAMVERGDALPAGLSVGGSLDLSRCTGLTSLPDGLSVDRWLDLSRCTGLTSLPAGLSVDGSLELRDCTGLTSLPDGLSVGGWLNLDGCSIKQSCVTLDQQLPETVLISMIGMRLGAVLQHRLIANPAFYDAIITAAGTDDDGAWIDCDSDIMPLVVASQMRRAA